ncbi:MAG: hypothetical protein HZA89_02420 [Verrucomicrobia bacterium]|nr:hypothetical protein [Verrucomicrobiota bacterium]
MAWRDFILKNFWLKLFSLALATVIWFTVNAILHEPKSDALVDDTAQQKFTRVPITVMMNAADTRSFRVVPGEVTVTVSGKFLVLQRITDKDIQAFVNLSAARDIEGAAKKIQIVAPEGVSLVRVDPAMVRIERVNSPQP